MRLPRWLPLVGLAIGLAYFALMSLAGGAMQSVPPTYDIAVSQLDPDSHRDGAACAQLDRPGIPLRPPVFVSGNGARPDLLAVRVEGRAAQLILSIGAVPDLAELVHCRAGAVVDRQKLGDSLPFSTRRVQMAQAAFELQDVRPDDVFLLRIVQYAALSFQIATYAPEDFRALADQRLILHVAFSSAAAFMVLYNAVLSLLARMPAFLFNALTVSSMLLLSLYMSGLGAAYLWPEKPWLANTMLLLALAGPALFAPFYVYRFIVPKQVPLVKARPDLLVWPGLAVLALAASVFVPYYIASVFLVGLWIALACVATWDLVRAARAGNPRASIMLLALLGAVVPGMMVGAAKEFGGWQFGALVPHLAELTILMEALLFTLALAYQLRLSRWGELQALRVLNRQAEAAKRDLLATIDSDRTRLAGDLHDGAGQMLGLISSRLKRAAQRDEMPDTARDEMRQTAGMVSDTLAEIRSMAHDLHPATLTHLGLEKAIAALCEHMSAASGIRFDCDLALGHTRLSPQQQLQVYRIVQELMTNTARHSGASDAVVTLRAGTGPVRLRYSDNGQSRDGAAGHGIGRTILEQRVASLNGRMARKSGPLGLTVDIVFDTVLDQEGGAL